MSSIADTLMYEIDLIGREILDSWLAIWSEL